MHIKYMQIHTQLQNHIYFTLEVPLGVIPSSTSPKVPFIPDTQAPPPPAATSVSPPPIYQEITDISTSRGRSAAGAVTANGPNTSLSSSTTHGQSSIFVPIADSGATT